MNHTFENDIWYHEAHVVVVFPRDLRFSGTSSILPGLFRLFPRSTAGACTRSSFTHPTRAHSVGGDFHLRTPVGMAEAAQLERLEHRGGPLPDGRIETQDARQ